MWGSVAWHLYVVSRYIPGTRSNSIVDSKTSKSDPRPAFWVSVSAIEGLGVEGATLMEDTRIAR
jgi:hypothetical protein